MKKIITIFISLMTFFAAQAQLPNGATAPDWTLSDINGTSHNLYSKLNAGKAVVLDFSAAYCPSCWSYHNSQALKTFYNNRGPNATNYQANVYFIEMLASNTTGCLYGSGGGGTPYQACTGSGSAGNWVANTPYPMIDNSSLNTDYNVNYFPMIYLVCPDKKAYLIGTQTAAQIDALMQTNCGITPGGGNTPLAISATNTVTNNKCFGENKGAIALTVSGGTPPFSYQWNNNQTSQNLTNLTAGNYKCTITDSQSKTLITNDIAVGQGAQIVANATVINNQKCATQGAINLSSSGGNGSFQFKWSTGATTQNLTNVTTAGTYKVTLTDGLGCNFVKDNIILQSADNQPTTSISNTLTLTCTVKDGQLKGAFLPKNANYTFTWTSQNGGNIVSKTDTTVNLNAAGTYTFKVEDKDSKCVSTSSYQVKTDTNVPQITSTSSNAVLNCKLKDAELKGTVLPKNTNYTYTWTSANGGNIVSKKDTTALINAAGTYTLKVENTQNNCSSLVAFVIASDTKVPKISFAPNAENLLTCKKTSITLSPTISDAGNATKYLWSSPIGTFISGTTSATATINAVANYSIKVTNTENACEASADFSITKAAEPTLILTQSKKILCYGEKTLEITTNTDKTATPITYLWSNKETTPTLKNVGVGAYGLTITDAYGCTVSQVSVAAEPPALQINVTTIKKPTTLNNDGAISIGVSGGVSAYEYAWTKNNVAYATTKNLTNLTAGTYKLLLTDANKCTLQGEPIILQAATSVGEIDGLVAFKAFPNPTNNEINIFLQLAENQLIKTNLYDAFGKIILQKEAINTAFLQEKIDVSSLPNGVYFLNIVIGKQQLIEKIVKF